MDLRSIPVEVHAFESHPSHLFVGLSVIENSAGVQDQQDHLPERSGLDGLISPGP